MVSVLFWSFQQITETAAARKNTYDALSGANNLLSSLKDTETSYRGYLLTGNKSFLAPYEATHDTIHAQLEHLRQIAQIPAAQQHLSTITPLINAELAETAHIIDLQQHNDIGAAVAAVDAGIGKQIMDSIRTETAEFLKIENVALLQCEAKFQADIRRMFGTIVVGSLLALAFAMWFVYLKYQEARHRLDNEKHIETQRLLDALKKTNVQLDMSRLAAENANTAKSDFLSSMSHELRTPLNAILGFAQLLETDTPPPSPSQVQSINQILKAGWHLLELVNETLDLSQIESGKVTLSNEPVSLSDVIRECHDMADPQAKKHHVSLTCAKIETPCYVYVDRTRFKQCLINLLSNAIKYNNSGGTVSVKCSKKAPDIIRLTVADTGRGLDSEQLKQLFQPFNRLGMEASSEEGSGIGLVVTKRLVELMGGTIGVDSSVGIGSEFWIEFPLIETPQFNLEMEQVALNLPQASPDLPLRTVLYVEDNPANLILVRILIMRRPDLRLLCAENAHLGIALARDYQPELILMDINLPGMSGTDAMQILREDRLTAHIPIIAISANAMPDDINAAIKAGFFHYLTKPIIVNEFMIAMNSALQFGEANSLSST